MAERYYPYVPWDDEDIRADILNHHTLHYDAIPRNGIYGPAEILKILVSGNGFKLCAQDDKTLCVVEQVYA